MRMTSILSGIALVACFGTATAADNFAVLKGVDSKVMSADDLSKVKGLHIHFAIITPNGTGPLGSLVPNASDNAAPHNGFIFEVNHTEQNLGGGQAKPGSGPGYSGLCGAALLSPALWIPGQNTTTGIGAGC